MRFVVCTGDFPPRKDMTFLIPEQSIGEYNVGDAVIVGGVWGYITAITDKTTELA